MDGLAVGATADHDRLGRFVTGNSAHHEKRRRIAALITQLSVDYAAESPVAQQLLRIAAEHLDQAGRTRNHVIRTRSTRAAAKVLDRIPKRPEPAPPTIAEWERRQREAEK